MNESTTGHDIRDPAVLEAVYREHIGAIQRFVARRVEDPHDAADLVADVFVAAGLLMRAGTDEFTVTIPPGTVRDDETFVLSAAHQTFPDTVDAAGNELTDRVSFAVEAELAAGSVEPCRVEQGDPLPEPPR